MKKSRIFKDLGKDLLIVRELRQRIPLSALYPITVRPRHRLADHRCLFQNLLLPRVRLELLALLDAQRLPDGSVRTLRAPARQFSVGDSVEVKDDALTLLGPS